MSDADEESHRMATRSSRKNSGSVSSSSSSAPTTLRVIASTVTEPTLNMPTTPAQLTEMIASAVATALTNQQPVNRDLFNSANSGSISNASIGPEIENIGSHIISLRIYIGRHHLLLMRLSSAVACRTLTPIILSGRPQSEDLLTLITKVRSKPIKRSSNPNGYSPRRCITNSKSEEETINSDDEYLYRHYIKRLYFAMTICISNGIQYLCPVATATTC